MMDLEKNYLLIQIDMVGGSLLIQIDTVEDAMIWSSLYFWLLQKVQVVIGNILQKVTCIIANK